MRNIGNDEGELETPAVMVPLEGPFSLDGKVLPDVKVTPLIQTGQPKSLQTFPVQAGLLS